LFWSKPRQRPIQNRKLGSGNGLALALFELKTDAEHSQADTADAQQHLQLSEHAEAEYDQR
jgi:hypothetical protein